MSKEAPERVVDDPNVAMQNSPEFDQLRSKFRRFVFPLTALFLAWYFLYVLLSVFAKDFMGTRVARQHHVGPDPRPPPVRLDLHDHDGLRPLGRPRLRPRGRSPRPEDGSEAVSALLTSAPSLVPAATTVGNPAINIGIFALFVVVTLAIVIRASRNNRSAAEYYAGGRAFTGRQNGIAIAGDYLSAASFLGIAGAIAINGYDGFLYSIGFLVAWLVALLLVAELLRNVGKYTMADVLSFRLRQRPVRIAAAISTLVVSFFYLLAQMAGAGGLVALLLGIEGAVGQRLVIVVVGILMIFYVIFGGMKGTTWVQIIKAVLLIIGAAIMTFWVLAKFGLSLSNLLGEATATSQAAGGKDLLQPGLQYKNPVDFISLSMALVLGTAGLPHVLMRFYTVPTSREARRSVVWAIWLIGIFYIFTLILGFGAADLRRCRRHQGRAGRRQLRRPAARLRARRRDPARHHLGGRLRDDPRGRRRPDDHRERLPLARHLQHGRQEGQGDAGGGGQGRPHRGTRPRRHRHHRWHLRPRPEHRLPRGAGLRHRGEREPADDPLLALLEAVQHPRRAVEHLRRPDQRHHADHLQPGRLGQAGRPGHGQEPVDAPGRRLPLVPARQPRHHLDPARLRARLHRHGHEPGVQRAKYAEMEVRSLTGHGAEMATTTEPPRRVELDGGRRVAAHPGAARPPARPGAGRHRRWHGLRSEGHRRLRPLASPRWLG